MCAAHNNYKVTCPSKFRAEARVVHLLAAAPMSRATAAAAAAACGSSNHHLRCACVVVCVAVVVVVFVFTLCYISASMKNQLVRLAPCVWNAPNIFFNVRSIVYWLKMIK